MKHYVSTRSVCPFYKFEHPQQIYCHGVMEGTLVHLAFASKADARAHKEHYCCSHNYHKCVMTRLYKEEHDGI